MGKWTVSFSNRVHRKTWSDLHSYEIRVALKEFIEEKQRRESKKRRKKERKHLQCIHVCMLQACISSDHFMTYSVVLNESSPW